MTADEAATAEAILAAQPEFDWLTQSATEWYTPAQVAEHLSLAPLTVRKIADASDIPGAVYYGRSVGWRLPRSGLLLYLARLPRTQQSTG